MSIQSLFVTQVYQAQLSRRQPSDLRTDIVAAALMLEREDAAGQAWCREQGYRGYTSYGSLNDLPLRASCFADLKRALDRHVRTFASACAFDLAGRKLKLDSLWVNVLPDGGIHSGHIHPHSVISGTYYAQLPQGAARLKFEDPRLGFMMAAPLRLPGAPTSLQPFFYLDPQEGEVALWESWLRHEVVMNQSQTPRISVSFNYSW